MPRKRKSDGFGGSSKSVREVRERGAELVRGKESDGKGGDATSSRSREEAVERSRRESLRGALKNLIALPRLKMVDPPCHFRHGSPESALKREERSRKFIEQAKKKEAKVKAANAVKRAELRTRREIAKNLFAKELLSVEVVAECVGLPIDSIKRLARETRRRKRLGGDV